MAKQLKETRDCILPPAFGRRKEYFFLFVAHPNILKVIIIRKIGNSFFQLNRGMAENPVLCSFKPQFLLSCSYQWKEGLHFCDTQRAERVVKY